MGLFIVMQVHTNMLYTLREEWKPMSAELARIWLPPVLHREKAEAPSARTMQKGLTEGELRRQRAIATKRRSTMLHRPSQKSLLSN